MKLRYILIASVLALVFGMFMVGQNATTAQNLATTVLAADSANQPVQAAQQNLASYIQGHMGASTTIFLAGAYQRAEAGSTTPPTTSGQVYHDAQAACVSHTSAVVQAKCVQSYVDSHTTPGTTDLQPVQVSKTPYTFAYVSPHWASDPGGWLLLIGLVGLATTVGIYGLRQTRHFGYTNKQ